MERYLVAYSIRGVQSFLMDSRSVRDLKNSSELISSIVFGVKQKLESEFGNGFELIPLNMKVLDALSFPNYFIAKVQSEDVEKIKGVLERAISEIVKEKLDVVVELAKKSEKDIEEIINRQMKGLLQQHWTIKQTKNDLNLEVKKLSKYHESTKRNPIIVKAEGAGVKCTTCGKWNIVFLSKKQEDTKLFKGKERLGQTTIKVEQNSFRLDEDEGLCVCCMLKRMFDVQSESFSTVAIATQGWRKNKKVGNTIKREFDEDAKTFQLKDIKEKECYDEKIYYKEYMEGLKDKKVEKFKEAINGDWCKNKYYAIVRLDMDSLSEWLEEDKEVGHKVQTFMDNVKSIMNDHGCCIFAGGDDALGLITLPKLVQCIEEIKLRDAFKDYGISECPTWSISIVIGHYKSQLKQLLRKSYNELKTVKKDYARYNKRAKQGVALSYVTYGGKMQDTYFSLNEWEGFKNIKESIDDVYTTSFVKKFEEVHTLLCEYNEELDIEKGLLNLELERFVKRSFKGTYKATEADKERLSKVNDWFYKCSEKNYFDKERFVNLIYIAEMIKSEERWAANER